MANEAGELASSVDDLMSAVPADIFDAPADGEGVDASADVNTGDTGDSAADGAPELEASEPEPETPEGEPPAEEEPPAEAAPPEENPPAEDLPEGVRRGKDRNGKEGVWIEKARWENTIHPHHKTVQQLSEMIGEPITAEALDLRNRAFLGQEMLYGDLLSGDAAAQSKVLNHFFDEAARALEDGSVSADPMVGFGEAFYNALRAKSPDGYTRLRLQAAKDLVAELYEEAGAKGNKNLWLSAGHVAKTLNLPFRQTEELENFTAGGDPLAALRTENESLKSQLNGRTAQNQTAQFESWESATRQKTTAAVRDEAIMPALSEQQKAWEKFPEAFNDLVVSRLHSAVRKSIEQDGNFQKRIDLLALNARRASAQRREEFAAQIRQAYVNRARLAVDAHKGKILTDAARLFKERSDANHTRRQAGQNQRTPTGPRTPAPRGIAPPAPKSGQFFDADTEARRWSQVMG